MKHRLVGAVLMVGVAVLVIPWLLSDQNIDGTATTEAEATTTIPTTGIKKQPASPASETAGPALLEENDSPGPDSELSATQSAPATAAGGWVVRVGTYSKAANGESTVALLTKHGFTARKAVVKTTLGDDATRIWLGPYAKKETAGEVSDRLKILIGEKGYVTKYAP